MSQIFNALSRALRDLIQLKILWIIIWPLLAAGLLWVFLGMIFWDTFVGWVAAGFSKIGIQDWLEGIEPQWIASAIQSVILWILFIPLVMATTLIITAIFAMPALINLVAKRHYPNLKRESGGTITGSLINALVATAIFILIWLVTLPMWLVGLGMIVPFAAAAYLNQQLFRYDSLSEHANRKEIKKLLATDRIASWWLGLLTGMVQFIPILNFFAPIFAALAFIHFELARLKTMRMLFNTELSEVQAIEP